LSSKADEEGWREALAPESGGNQDLRGAELFVTAVRCAGSAASSKIGQIAGMQPRRSQTVRKGSARMLALRVQQKPEHSPGRFFRLVINGLVKRIEMVRPE
jgi:hypothetical protein